MATINTADLPMCLTQGSLTSGSILTIFICGLILILISIISRQANFNGKKYFLISNVAAAYWLAMATFEMVTHLPSCKILGAMLTWPGITLLPAAWFMFVVSYTLGVNRDWMHRAYRWLPFIPFIGSLPALTNPWHGLFYTDETTYVLTAQGFTISYSHGPLFYLTALVLYVPILGSIGLLFLSIWTSAKEHRGHLSLLLTLTVVPLIGNGAYIVSGYTIFGFDPTPFLFAMIVICYAVMIFFNQHLDLNTIANRLIFENHPHAIMVVTTEGVPLSMNDSAKRLFPHLMEPYARSTSWLKETVKTFPLSSEASIEVEAEHNGHLYSLKANPILAPVRNWPTVIAWTIFIDDTPQRHREKSILLDELEARSVQLNEAVEAKARAEAVAQRDALTGLLNRRALKSAASRLNRTPAGRDTYIVTMIDIDQFKPINDTYGHPIGDLVLIEVATALSRSMRDTDSTYRIGGEEFLILSKNMSFNRVCELLDAARSRLSNSKTLREVMPDRQVHFSAGATLWFPNEDRLEVAIREADQYLYRAKAEGGNRTCRASADAS